MPLKFNPLTGSLDLVSTKVEPTGSDGQIQFNDGGSFGASSDFVWDNDVPKFLARNKVPNPDYNPEFCIILQDSTGQYYPRFCDEYIIKSFEVNLNNTNMILGRDSESSGSNSIALLDYSKALKDNSIAMGTNSVSNGTSAITIGQLSENTGSGGTVIGIQAKSTGIQSTLVGSASDMFSDYSSSIGYSNLNNGEGSVTIGRFNEGYGEDSVTIGRANVNNGNNSILFGTSTVGFNTPINNKNNVILFGLGTASNLQYLLEAEYDKGVRIGATSGETINMAGEDLYVVGQIEGHGYTKNITTKTAAYTLAANDDVVICSGTFTITLPLAGSYQGKVYTIKNKSTGTITVGGDGVETIDGSTTQDLIQHETITIISDGTEWWII